jgi:hypothetical protein
VTALTTTPIAVGVGALVASVAVVALTLGSGDEGSAAPRAFSPTGDVRVVDSRDGRAVLAAVRMVPGGSAQGTVTISNAGDASGAARLEPYDLFDNPGPGGALLSHSLILDVTDAAGRAVYRGPLVEQPAADLGTFDPGEQRTYRFVATLPRSAGNEYQKAQAGVGFRWTMTGGGERPPEPRPSAPEPSPPTGDAPAPRAGRAPNVGTKRLTVRVRRTRIGRTLSRRRIRLTVSCSRPCRATITATARWGKGRTRVRKVKRATRRLLARPTTVRLVVPKAVRNKKRFTLRVTVRAIASGGSRAAVTRSFRLKKPRYQVRVEGRRRR